jgi:hypothetical protein
MSTIKRESYLSNDHVSSIAKALKEKRRGKGEPSRVILVEDSRHVHVARSEETANLKPHDATFEFVHVQDIEMILYSPRIIMESCVLERGRGLGMSGGSRCGGAEPMNA